MSDQVPAQESAPGHKVFAGNLAYSVNEDALKAFFAPVESEILSVQVIMRGTRSAGYGFVTVQSLDAAQKACEQLDKTELEGRQVVIEVAKPSEQKDKERAERRASRRAGRARGRAPPGELTEAEANGDVAVKTEDGNEASAGAEGETKRSKPKKKRLPRKKNAKTESASGEGTQGEAAAEGEAAAPKKQRTPRPKRAPRPAGEEPQGEPSKNVLFVANLGFNIDDAGLAQLFKDAEINVISARIVRRRWGKPRRSKGYGFVDVGGEDEQKKAIAALEGKEIEGRAIAVKVAVNAGHEDDEEAAPGQNGTTEPQESAAEATATA